jgi:hypothetical protein
VKSVIKKPPCEQGGYLTIACHMNKLFITVIADKLNYEPYFLVFVESVFLTTVSTLVLEVSVILDVVSGVVGATLAVSVVFVVESVVEEELPLLLQATKAPAIAKIPRNFFMRF